MDCAKWGRCFFFALSVFHCVIISEYLKQWLNYLINFCFRHNGPLALSSPGTYFFVKEIGAVKHVEKFSTPRPALWRKILLCSFLPPTKNTLNFSPDASRRWINIPLLVTLESLRPAGAGVFLAALKKITGFLINQDISIQEYWLSARKPQLWWCLNMCVVYTLFSLCLHIVFPCTLY